MMHMNRGISERGPLFLLRTLLLSVLGVFAAQALAAYPDRPIRLIVPSPAGGGTDSSTRAITPKLSEVLRQNIIIDNRGGASGNLGAEMAAQAPADGYTLLAIIASHTSNPAVMRSVPFDLARDFAPISRTVSFAP